MPYIFDGRKFAAEKEEDLRIKVTRLKKRGITPKLVSVVVGDDPGSILYQNLKKKAAEKVGAILEIRKLRNEVSRKEVTNIISKTSADRKVDGIMIQLPLPDNFSKEDKEVIINAIAREKDIDGLRPDSSFLHPTAMAVLEILEHALNIVRPPLKTVSLKVCVVGATGMVGGPLTKELRTLNNELRLGALQIRHSDKRDIADGHSGRVQNLQFEVLEADSHTEYLSELTKSADVLISCAGVPEIIKKDMVKEGAVLIDVGAPVGDISKDAYEKAFFVSPVPGGVGPVTIVKLIENLIFSSENIQAM